MEVRLRRDGMKAEVKLACLKELHPECFYLIENSSSRESLKVGCGECKEKYRRIVEGGLKAPAKLNKPRATRGYLLERVIFLERQNALLEREVEEWKAGKLGKGGSG